MEQDKQLKQILSFSSEDPSPDFTDAVMKKITELPASCAWQPLLSRKLKRVLIFTYASLISLILLLSLIISPPELPGISLIQQLPLSHNTFNEIITFLLTCCIVFTINSFMQKGRFTIRRGMFS